MKNKLIRYTMQLAMLKQLLEKKLISIDEYNIVKNKLMKDYNIISDITT
ncbi:SHOCT domain-containing protein [Clostridium perfringens]